MAKAVRCQTLIEFDDGRYSKCNAYAFQSIAAVPFCASHTEMFRLRRLMMVWEMLEDGNICIIILQDLQPNSELN